MFIKNKFSFYNLTLSTQKLKFKNDVSIYNYYNK